MGIAVKVALWLRSNGHDAIHLNDEALFQLADNLIVEKAIKEKRIILTADMDFGQLLSLNKIHSVSVIQFRVSDFTPKNIISKMGLLLENFSEQLNEEFLITVEDNRLRYRKLPL